MLTRVFRSNPVCGFVNIFEIMTSLLVYLPPHFYKKILKNFDKPLSTLREIINYSFNQ